MAKKSRKRDSWHHVGFLVLVATFAAAMLDTNIGPDALLNGSQRPAAPIYVIGAIVGNILIFRAILGSWTSHKKMWGFVVVVCVAIVIVGTFLTH